MTANILKGTDSSICDPFKLQPSVSQLQAVKPFVLQKILNYYQINGYHKRLRTPNEDPNVLGRNQRQLKFSLQQHSVHRLCRLKREEGGGLKNCQFYLTTRQLRGGKGVKNCLFLDGIVYVRPLSTSSVRLRPQSDISWILEPILIRTRWTFNDTVLGIMLHFQ